MSSSSQALPPALTPAVRRRSPAGAALQASGIFTPFQYSLFLSFVTIGAMAGSAASGFLSDGIGRKGAISVATLPLIAGWAMIYTLSTFPLLLAGRLLTGLGVGLLSALVPVYIAEISPPSHRGRLGATNQLSVTLGILLVYVAGLDKFRLSWRDLALGALIPLALLLLGSFALPESPSWLCARGRREEALASLRTLRGAGANVRPELHEMQAAALAAAAAPPVAARDFLTRPALRTPFFLSVMLMVFQQFSGINAVIFNSAGILASTGMKNAGLAAMSVALLQVVATGASVALMDVAGRRPLLITAAAGMFASALSLGVAFETHRSGVAVAAMLVYIASFSIGMGPIPWLLMSEGTFFR